jgi:hypothetical protein
MKRCLLVILVLGVLGVNAGALVGAPASETLRMTKEELKPLLGNPEVIIVDGRSASDYKRSQEKIEGAVREEPVNVKTIMDRYPKNKTFVLY